MEKIKILILSCSVILVFGDSIESHAQFSYANENCHDSLMPPPLSNWSFSALSSVTSQKDTNEKRLTTVEKILNVPIGIVIGSLCGFVIGGAIPSDYSPEKLANFIKGGLIGAFAGPFVNYEIMSAMKGAKNPLNKWYFKAGGNIIIPNYEDAIIKMGYSIDIGRAFPLNGIIALQGELGYQARQFSLSSQRILFATMVSREIRYCDIDFSVGYIDISLLLNFKLFRWRKSTLSIALGPSLAIEVFDNTKYHLIKVEEDHNDFDFIYIDDEPDPLFGYPALLYKLEFQRNHWIWQLGFHHSVTYTDEIYPLISNTRLRTFELSIGYKL
jgi:hypothetical protein